MVVQASHLSSIPSRLLANFPSLQLVWILRYIIFKYKYYRIKWKNIIDANFVINAKTLEKNFPIAFTPEDGEKLEFITAIFWLNNGNILCTVMLLHNLAYFIPPQPTTSSCTLCSEVNKSPVDALRKFLEISPDSVNNTQRLMILTSALEVLIDPEVHVCMVLLKFQRFFLLLLFPSSAYI